MKTKINYKKVSIVILALWTAFMLFMLLAPANMLSQRQSSFFNIPHSDKIIHCGLFCVFTYLLQIVLVFNSSLKTLKLYFVSIVVVLSLGMLTEILQALTFDWCGRRFELKDYFCDVLGGVFALVFFKIREKKVCKRLQNEK
ncbi:MAG: VanZ family protein [Bacteroidales bacterium]|nr:VanZ family protein [Bacteroidales bacterium]